MFSLIQIVLGALKWMFIILVMSWVVMTVPWQVWVGFVLLIFVIAVVANWLDNKTWRGRMRLKDVDLMRDKRLLEEAEEREERWQ